MWGLMAGLRGLSAMGAYYCLGAGWSQWRPLGLPGHPSSTQLNAVVITIIRNKKQTMFMIHLNLEGFCECGPAVLKI